MVPPAQSHPTNDGAGVALAVEVGLAVAAGGLGEAGMAVAVASGVLTGVEVGPAVGDDVGDGVGGTGCGVLLVQPAKAKSALAPSAAYLARPR